MIWIVKGDESHQIISSNVFETEETEEYEVWVTRPNGKNLKIMTHKEKSEAKLLKEALDFAIKDGHTTFTVD